MKNGVYSRHGKFQFFFGFPGPARVVGSGANGCCLIWKAGSTRMSITNVVISQNGGCSKTPLKG
jgi:hypothetical protein